jgi:phosphohistidine phosphatase
MDITVRRVYLLRHAKSSWEDLSLADDERPLAPRGRKAAKRMARHLRHDAIRPDLVLCSTALRAKQTLERIEPALGGAPTRVEPGLYAASAETLLTRLRRLPDDVVSVMVIAHNPGLRDLASMLASGGRALPRLRAKYPTCALATLDIDSETWPKLQPGEAELVNLVTPGDIG